MGKATLFMVTKCLLLESGSFSRNNPFLLLPKFSWSELGWVCLWVKKTNKTLDKNCISPCSALRISGAMSWFNTLIFKCWKEMGSRLGENKFHACVNLEIDPFFKKIYLPIYIPMIRRNSNFIIVNSEYRLIRWKFSVSWIS